MTSRLHIPTYAIVGSGGHRVNVGKDYLPQITWVPSEDGQNVNRPLPNWLVPMGEPVPSWFPRELLEMYQMVPATGTDGSRYNAIYEHPLLADVDGMILTLNRDTLVRMRGNAQQLYGEDHYGAILSEASIRDQMHRHVRMERLFYTLGDPGQEPSSIQIKFDF